MENKGLKNLKIWQHAIDLASLICKNILPTFPLDEKWSLANQLRRSVQSIPANIAEGYGRYYYQGGVRYCYIARGSLEETFSHLVLANRLGYLKEDTFTQLALEIEMLQKSINAYIAYLKTTRRGANEPGSQNRISEESPLYNIDPSDTTNVVRDDQSPIDQSLMD